MERVTIDVDYPPALLSPNGRPGDPRQKARLAKRYRQAASELAFVAACSQLENARPEWTEATVKLIYQPARIPNRIDPDNMIAWAKSAIDGNRSKKTSTEISAAAKATDPILNRFFKIYSLSSA